MSKSIKLSPKHGLNPVIPTCVWCGRPKNQVAFLGRIDTKTEKDVEAPKNMVLDYEPCDDCAAQWAACVIVIAVSETPRDENQPPLMSSENGKPKKLYPTGQVVGIYEETAQALFPGSEAKNGKRVLIPNDAFDEIFSEALKQAGRENKESEGGGGE